MWDIIAAEVNKSCNINVSAANCENRWRVLERKYKKFLDHNASTGRGRKDFEYEETMRDILGQKKNIIPEVLLDSSTIGPLIDNENIEEPRVEGNVECYKIH